MGAIRDRATEFDRRRPLVMLLVITNTDHARDVTVTEQLASTVATMIRPSDVVAVLNPGELALVVFDLPEAQHEVFRHGITMAATNALASTAATAEAELLVGAAILTHPGAVTDTFRRAHRNLAPSPIMSVPLHVVVDPDPSPAASDGRAGSASTASSDGTAVDTATEPRPSITGSKPSGPTESTPVSLSA